MLKKESMIKIAIILLLIPLVLVACTKSDDESRPYSRLNKKTGYWEIDAQVFEEIASIKDDEIDPNVPEEFYIAMFNFTEYKDLYTSTINRQDKPSSLIFFTDINGDVNYIYNSDQGIKTRKQAILYNPDIYLEEVKDISEDKFHLWEDLISFNQEVYHGAPAKEYKVTNFELGKVNSGAEALIITFDGGTVLRAHLDKFTFGISHDHKFSDIADKEDDIADTNDGDESIAVSTSQEESQTSHSKSYKPSDLQKLPIEPMVTPNKQDQNGLYNFSIHYPSFNKKYNLYIIDSTDADVDYLNKAFNIDKLKQCYEFRSPYIEELEDRVRVTSYFNFYVLPSPEIADIIHEYVWDGHKWILINEEIDLYDHRYLLEVESNGVKTADILGTVEDEVWVCPDLDGVIIKFSEGKVYNGYFRSEVDSIDNYKVVKVADNYIDLLIENNIKARINIVEVGKKIQIRFDNNGHIEDRDYIIDREWEKILGW